MTHRAPSPGTILSPWLVRRGLLVAGTTDSQVVAVWPATYDSVERQGGRAGPGLTGGQGRYYLRREPAGHALPSGPRNRAGAEQVVELDWPVTAPLTAFDGQILLGGADGTLRALRPDGTEVWRVQLWRPVELGPVALDDGILAIGGDGDLHRYRQ